MEVLRVSVAVDTTEGESRLLGVLMAVEHSKRTMSPNVHIPSLSDR